MAGPHRGMTLDIESSSDDRQNTIAAEKTGDNRQESPKQERTGPASGEEIEESDHDEIWICHRRRQRADCGRPESGGARPADLGHNIWAHDQNSYGSSGSSALIPHVDTSVHH
jgi:hypothetical protein